MDINQIFKALKTAAKIVQDKKASAPVLAKSNLKDSYETILEQYCIKNRLQWSRDAPLGSNRGSLLCRMSTEFFRLDIQIVSGNVIDVWVLHQQRGHLESCPQIAKALRLRDMSEFDVHVTGLWKMYTFSADKAKRPSFFLCLCALEEDLYAIHKQLIQWNVPPLELVRSGPVGLIAPRMDGIPFRLGFFVAPANLVELNGTSMKKEYHVIAGRQIGLWVSVGVKASKGLPTTLPITNVYRSTFQDVGGRIICEFTPVGGGHELPGSFVLSLDKPMVLLESAAGEIRQITGLEVQPVSKMPNGVYVETLRGICLPGVTSDGLFRVILPGQHHSYTLMSPDQEALTVSDISFSHLAQVPAVLKVLRRQAALNEIIGSCVRDVDEDEVIDPFAFCVTVLSSRLIGIAFTHPLDSTAAKVQIRFDDHGGPSFQWLESNRLCGDHQATVWLNKTFSIPVVLKTMIDRLVQSYSTVAPSITATASVRAAVEPTARNPTPAMAAPPTATPPVLEIFSQLLESPRPSPATPKDVKFEAHAGLSGLFLGSAAAPSPTPHPPVKPLPSASKMDRMLKEGKTPPPLLSPGKDKPVAMDLDLHARKMKELYEVNPKKKLRRQGSAAPLGSGGGDTAGGRDRADKDNRTLKRRLSNTLTPPGSVPSTPMRSDSLDASNSMELQPRSEPTLTTKLRVNRNADSPHGSPTPIKLKLSMQPSTSDPANPTFQAVLLNTKESPPKKKKVRVPDSHAVEHKQLGTKIEFIKKQPPGKRDVFDFDGGPEAKKLKKEPTDHVDSGLIAAATAIDQPKKIKKEQSGEVEFLPEIKSNKKGADLSELGATLQRKSGGSAVPGGVTKTSPLKPGSSPIQSTQPRPHSAAGFSKLAVSSQGHPSSSSAPKSGSHKDSAGSSGMSKLHQLVQSPPKVGLYPSKSVPTGLPPALGLPKSAAMSASNFKIPKKTPGGAAAASAPAAPPLTSGAAGGAAKPPAAALPGPLTVPKTSTLTEPSHQNREETPGLISALLTPFGGSGGVAGAARAALLPTPASEPSQAWGSSTGAATDKRTPEKPVASSLLRAPIAGGGSSSSPAIAAAIAAATGVNPTYEKPASDKPPSLFQQIVGVTLAGQGGALPPATAPLSAAEEEKKAGLDSALSDSNSSLTAALKARSNRPSLTAILDRLQSKSRVDFTEGSHDSSDLQDHVFKQLSEQTDVTVVSGGDVSVVVGRTDTVTSPEIPLRNREPSVTLATSSAEPIAAAPAVVEAEKLHAKEEPEKQLVVVEAEKPKEEPTAAAAATAKSLILVPYSSDDDASCDESALPPSPAETMTMMTRKEVLVETVQAAPALAPQSPEIMDHRPMSLMAAPATETVVNSSATTAINVETPSTDVVMEPSPPQPSTSMAVPDAVVLSRLTGRLSEDRTSPLIVDDPMLDAAFFPTDDEKN
ncbi:putative Mediator of RNA polymerase II transcription subunit 1 [Hypsibius exemplaris]|uniref:Mediator of RNA polymerase II transcription subunit 1 n=1 Tax=Hypsibius exemplaris TaxID=2072580 RepID=A0A1W0WWI8_HYPEX|nr:putative Mediator of RNA polymerase II transcription subunit 1 [Hypsibius exemplaris]